MRVITRLEENFKKKNEKDPKRLISVRNYYNFSFENGNNSSKNK